MTRVNIPISLDTAFEALANLAGDSGGAGGDGTLKGELVCRNLQLRGLAAARAM